MAALKKHNAQLASRCRDEAKAKLREHEERVETQDKVVTVAHSLAVAEEGGETGGTTKHTPYQNNMATGSSVLWAARAAVLDYFVVVAW